MTTSIYNQYTNLPGSLIAFQDGGKSLRTDPTPVTTKSILILGTSVDGPKFEPVAVDNESAALLFGSDVTANGLSNGTSLIPGFKTAYDNGNRDIRLMRITGESATATLQGTSGVSNNTVKIEDALGSAVVLGNDATTITVQHYPIVAGTGQVFSKTLLEVAKVTVTAATGQFVIAANATNAGDALTFKYDYTVGTDTPITDTLTLDATHKATLTKTPKTGSTYVVKHNGTTVPSADYTVTGSQITVNTYDGTVVPATNDSITVAYTYVVNTVYHATEAANASGTPYKAATSTQVIPLSDTPLVGTVHLYSNNADVLTPNAFTVDSVAKTITIDKSLLTMGAVLRASYLSVNTDPETQTIELQSTFAGDVYNQCAKQVIAQPIGVKVILTKPDSKKASANEAPLEYRSADYPTFKLLVDAINNDPNNNVFTANTAYEDAATDTIALDAAPVSFTGGDNGTNASKVDLFNALSGIRDNNGNLIQVGAYQILEDYQVDIVCPQVYSDDILPGDYQNFAYELALFCAVSTYRNNITVGAIAFKPCTDTRLSGIKDYANYLASYNNVYYMRDYSGNVITDSKENPIDIGQYIATVAGPETKEFDSSTLNGYYGNPAIAFAAEASTLPSSSAPTNKQMQGALGLKYRFSASQLDSITANRIITFKSKTAYDGTSNNAYIVDAPTAAAPGSAYSRWSTQMCMLDLSKDIKEVTDPYIGEANSPEQRTAMASAISKRLGIRKDEGTIQGYDFSIVATTLDELLGQAKIELSVVPSQELRKVTTIVTLNSAS